MVDAVRSLLETLGHRISSSEHERLLNIALDMQTRRTAILRMGVGKQMSTDVEEVGAQDGSRAQVNVQAISQGHGRGQGIRLIHQVYGVFGDKEPMSSLFETSHRRWKEIARCMSAHYHLWNAEEMEALVKQRYPQHWDMYCSVRYPIMRCDIGRLLILHAFGGLYADLDTMPNRGWYEEARFALARVKDPKKNGLSSKEKRNLAQGSLARERAASVHLEMKVIVGTRGNDIFLRWVDHMDKEIVSKPYAEANSYWRNARMRYVHNTTGPRSMNRFLHLPINTKILQTLKFLESNHCTNAETPIAVEKRCFDVLSYESDSYLTKAHEIHVPVGTGHHPLPALPKPRRLRLKTASDVAIVTNVEHAERLETHVQIQQQAHSQGNTHVHKGTQCDLLPSQPTSTDGNVFEKQRLEEELKVHRDRETQIKTFFKEYRRGSATKLVIQDMPRELAKWLVADGYVK